MVYLVFLIFTLCKAAFPQLVYLPNIWNSVLVQLFDTGTFGQLSVNIYKKTKGTSYLLIKYLTKYASHWNT